jgi:predicted MFS family arabinose efflux permease
LRVRLSLLMALQYAFPGALLQLYSLHLTGLGFGPLAVGVCCATQALATVLTALLVGQAADRWFAPERCLAVCSAAAGVVLLLLPCLDGFVSVFSATLLFWLLANPILLLGATISFTRLRHPDQEYGSVRLWGTVGWAVPGWLLLILSFLGLPLLQTGGIAVLFRAGSVFAFALAGFALTLPRTPRQPAASRHPAPLAALRLLRGRTFATHCLCTFGVCVTWPFSTQATPMLLRQIGVAPEWLCPTLSLGQFTEVIGLFALPVLLSRFGVRGTMLAGLVAWTVALTILAAGQPAWLVVASLGLNGVVVSAFLVGGQVYVNRHATGDVRASAQALITFVNGVGMLVGHLLVGYLRSSSGGELPQVFAVGAACTAAFTLLFWLGFRERPVLVESEPAPTSSAVIRLLPSGRGSARPAARN